MCTIKLVYMLLLLSVFATCIRFDLKKSKAENNSATYKLNGAKHKNGNHHHHFKESSAKGYSDDEKRKNQHSTDGGHEHEHHTAHTAADEHDAASSSRKGGKYDEKSGHKKGHKTKGWHNTFMRDEYHKEHRFYDDAHRSGAFEKYGAGHQNYRKASGASAAGDKSTHRSRKGTHGKKGRKERGRSESEHKGHSARQGKDKFHKKTAHQGRKGKSQQGKQYGYQQKHR